MNLDFGLVMTAVLFLYELYIFFTVDFDVVEHPV